jgi:hypothetical protein
VSACPFSAGAFVYDARRAFRERLEWLGLDERDLGVDVEDGLDTLGHLLPQGLDGLDLVEEGDLVRDFDFDGLDTAADPIERGLQPLDLKLSQFLPGDGRVDTSWGTGALETIAEKFFPGSDEKLPRWPDYPRFCGRECG